MFESAAIQDIIEFKWDTFAWRLHYRGAFFHVFYILTVAFYIYSTFLNGVFGDLEFIGFPIMMIVGIIYPFTYDTIQMYKSGWSYFEDVWNWIDIIF